MAKIIAISVRIGRTISLGNYEFLRIDVEEEIEVARGEDVEVIQHEVRASLHDKLDYLAKEELAAIRGE